MREIVKETFWIVLFLPFMAVAALVSIPPAMAVMIMWRLRNRQ